MKNKFISSKTYVCSLCDKTRTGNVDQNNSPVCWCWLCVDKLLNTPNEKRKEIHKKLLEKGFIEKAKIIERWLPEEEVEYEEVGRTVVRRRTNKQVPFKKQEWKKRKNR